MHFDSLDTSLVPDAAVQRPSEGASRVVELGYVKLEKAMFALQEVPTAETAERVDLVDVEEGQWAWKDVLVLSEWGTAIWKLEMCRRTCEQLATDETERGAEEGSRAKRAGVG